MKNKRQLLIKLVSLMLCVSACASATASPALTINPQDCELPVAGEIPITLNGPIIPNSQVNWKDLAPYILLRL
jgi:hypothetical protein